MAHNYVVALSLLALSCQSAAQTGRGFTSIEAYVGSATSVYVGHIVKVENIPFDQPFKNPLHNGRIYRVGFEIDETIRGVDSKSIEITIVLQYTPVLETFLKHKTELMLVDSEGYVPSYPMASIGFNIGEKTETAHSYQFRIFEELPEPETSDGNSVERNINNNYDNAKFFSFDLSVVKGRENVLKKARAFQKLHPEPQGSVWLQVPNPFGAQVGSPNAYCGINLPECPEVGNLIAKVLENPSKMYELKDENDTSQYLYFALKAFKPFKSPNHRMLVQNIYNKYSSAVDPGENVRTVPWDIKELAAQILKDWDEVDLAQSK